jgi:hypothetical protein
VDANEADSLIDRELNESSVAQFGHTLLWSLVPHRRPSGEAPLRRARAGSSLGGPVLPDSVVEQHPSASTGEGAIAGLVKARPTRGNSPPSPQSQETPQMLPASGIVCTLQRLPVLRQERLMLAIRQDAEDTLRVERILLLGISGQRNHDTNPSPST